MNSSLRQSWAQALRSGKYAQGKGTLRSSEWRYCAMGVLYDLICSDRERLQEWGSLLSNDRLSQIGLTSADQGRVAQLNDLGVSFEQIADIIDADADLEIALHMSVNREILRIQSASLSFSYSQKLVAQQQVPVFYFHTAFSSHEREQ